jgi:hypothetical protein
MVELTWHAFFLTALQRVTGPFHRGLWQRIGAEGVIRRLRYAPGRPLSHRDQALVKEPGTNTGVRILCPERPAHDGLI